MLHRIKVFHSPEYVTLDEMTKKNAFWTIKYDNHRTGKEYPMNDEARQTEIQVQIFQKSSIIIDRFSLYIF